MLRVKYLYGQAVAYVVDHAVYWFCGSETTFDSPAPYSSNLL